MKEISTISDSILSFLSPITFSTGIIKGRKIEVLNEKSVAI